MSVTKERQLRVTLTESQSKALQDHLSREEDRLVHQESYLPPYLRDALNQVYRSRVEAGLEKEGRTSGY